MEELPIIRDLVIILSVSIPIIFLFKKFDSPSIVGFLLAGIIIGPYGFELISKMEQIEAMAEVGVILLLFTIGLEVSVKQLVQMKRLLIVAGGLQIMLTIILSALIFTSLGFEVNQSVYLGMLLSLSSTAIVLRLLSDKGEIEAPHGRISLGILIFQDLAIVPMIFVLPMLSLGSHLTLHAVSMQLLFAFGALAVVIIAARYLMPKLMFQLARLRIREAFTVGIILIVLGTAYITHLTGSSLALGAFVAGLILSESDFSHQIVAEILPLKDAFNSIFFVSIGLLLNLYFVLQNPAEILMLVAGIIILKALVIIAIIKFLRYPVRTAIMSGIALAQIGEFSFVLAQEGLKFNLILPELFNAFLASSIFTMLLTPFLLKLSPILAAKLDFFDRYHKTIGEEAVKLKLNDHVIIVGFGLNGRNLARVLKETGINYVVIELNPETVRNEKSRGERIIFGDITKEEILHKTCIDTADVIVFAISDPASTKLGLRIAKNINPNVHAIVRTRYSSEIDELMRLGADVVIPEEFETSLQIFRKVLEIYHIPPNVIMQQIALLRSESYKIMVKELSASDAFMHINEILAAGLTETFYVTEANLHLNKKLSELNLRAKTDATVIAIIRRGKTIANPSGSEQILLHDTLIITGTHNAVDRAVELLSESGELN